MKYAGKSKEQLRELSTEQLKEEVGKSALNALKRGKKNGPKAKLARRVLRILAMEERTESLNREIDEMVKRMGMSTAPNGKEPAKAEDG